MQLDTFITETLMGIIGGVANAQEPAAAAGARINPFGFRDPKGPQHGNLGIPAGYVDFDVAVTTTRDKEKSGSGKITVWGVGLGGQTGAASSDTQVTRIRFKVPIMFPQAPEVRPKNQS